MILSRGCRRGVIALGAVVLAVVVLARVVVDDDVDGTASAPEEVAAEAWTLSPHTGLGAWVDVYDWTLELTGGQPSVDLDDVDAMAEQGIQTMYIQTAHHRSTAKGVIEEDRLLELITRASDHGINTVAWYLPTLEDPAADLRRLSASAALAVGGLAVDIESVEVADPAERNRRLLELSADLKAALGPDRVLAAITPSAVHLQVVNPGFWPGFPWAEVASTYDVLLPMTYWSIREGELRNAETYVGENLDRIRVSTGDTDIPIVPIGGIADAIAPADLQGMVRAIEARGSPGGGLYDWVTSTPEQWEILAPLRERKTPAPRDRSVSP